MRRLLARATARLTLSAPMTARRATSPRAFTTAAARAAASAAKAALPPRTTVPEDEIEEKFLKGSGPGGQKINKTNSAVQLQHIPTGTVVKCQDTRSRTQNRGLARRLLAAKLDELANGAQSREGVKGERKRARKMSARKKARRKYRALGAEEGKEAEDGEERGESVFGQEGEGEERRDAARREREASFSADDAALGREKSSPAVER